MLVTLVDQNHEPFCKWHPARVAINRFYRDNSQFDNKSRYEPACSDRFRSYIHFIRSVPRDFSAAGSQKDRGSARGNQCTRWVERERIEGKRKGKGREERKEEKKCSRTPSYPSGDGRREIWEHWKSRGIVSSSKHALRRIVTTAQRENFSRYGSRSASGYRYEKKEKKRKKMEKKFCSSKQYVNILYKRISNFYSSLWKFFFIFFFYYLARSLKFIYSFFLSVSKYFLNAYESLAFYLLCLP